MYSYEYNGLFYVGSTTNLTKRKQEHTYGKTTKTGNTELNSAFKMYDSSNFNYKVVESPFIGVFVC